jgi:putative DNA primase/helicase
MAHSSSSSKRRFVRSEDLNYEDISKMVGESIADEQDQQKAKAGERRLISGKELKKLIFDGERGVATLMKRLCKGSFVYDHSEGIWYRFTEHSYQKDIVGGQFGLIEQTIKFLESERRFYSRKGEDEGATGLIIAQIPKLINCLNSLNVAKRVLEYAVLGENSLGIKGEEWDQNLRLIGFENGVLDLKTLEFRNGRPEDYIREIIPHQWKGLDEKAPRWDQFLSEILPLDSQDSGKGGDIEVIRYLQRLLGYSLTGQSNENVFPILIGKGQNGKGTMLELLAQILGRYAGPVPSEMLMEQSFARSSSAPSADKMALRGRRLAWASESNEGKRLDAAKVKSLAGGDKISARAPYGKHQIEFKPTHLLFLLTNHAPEVDPDDRALWYRLRLIPFPVSFVENPSSANERAKDPKLKEILLKEAPGILAWIVKGYVDYVKNGLKAPDKVMAATKSYRSDNDLLSQFISECLIADAGKSIQASRLYAAYSKWAESNKLKPLSGVMFGKKISEKIGKSSRTNKASFYRGYRLT